MDTDGKPWGLMGAANFFFFLVITDTHHCKRTGYVFHHPSTHFIPSFPSRARTRVKIQVLSHIDPSPHKNFLQLQSQRPHPLFFLSYDVDARLSFNRRAALSRPVRCATSMPALWTM
ncbi:hypothetical protein AC578_1372 [Pseudocercospora eumusae]|uniref:Uncharacterized protein n=1 Tax=Pseudocercospora eumusae TaxID=321146 RepID=A0A139HUS6_9PEZI|nr:hypothetical protein AC578_1372 [Pseudocercospora eumusae]KXT06167.1 hypothetical protein AC578_1372 [Pseudocercospora eumusae]